MRFNTHDRTPRPKTKKSLKILFGFMTGLFLGTFLFMAVVCSLEINSIVPAVVILTPTIIITALIAFDLTDISKAYIEIIEDKITVVDYNFSIKKEKNFLLSDISYSEILLASSMRVRGKRIGKGPFTYIVFRDKNDKFMFKVLYTPESKQFFANYIKQ